MLMLFLLLLLPPQLLSWVSCRPGEAPIETHSKRERLLPVLSRTTRKILLRVGRDEDEDDDGDDIDDSPAMAAEACACSFSPRWWFH